MRHTRQARQSRAAQRCGHTGAVRNWRWVNRHQPQTLYSAVMLSYFRGASIILFRSSFYSYFAEQLVGSALGSFVPLLLLVAFGLGALGVANERKWGYWACVGASTFATLATIYWTIRFGFDLNLGLRLMFDIALVAMLLHPQSREYRRIWFK